MSKLWLLKGSHSAPGWDGLRDDSKAERVDIIHLDPGVWALIRADDPPRGYQELEAVEPVDGLYLDPHGRPLYLANGEIVDGPLPVIEALGPRAQELLEKIGDAETVLDRLGRAF